MSENNNGNGVGGGKVNVNAKDFIAKYRSKSIRSEF